MSMSHEESYRICIAGSGDYSEAIRRVFLSVQDPGANYSHKYDSFRKENDQYYVSCSENGYYEEGVFWNQCCELAEESDVVRFKIIGDIQNDGSGGNYSEELYATFEYGKLSYRYIIDSADAAPNERTITRSVQLKPRILYRDDIAANLPSVAGNPAGARFLPFAETVPDNQKKLMKSSAKKPNPNQFDVQLKSALYDDNGNPTTDHDVLKGFQLYYYELLDSKYHEYLESVLRAADSYVALFRDDDVDCDRESELRQGYIRKGSSLHAFKSFVWTAVEYCKKNRVSLEDFSVKDFLDLCQFIYEQGGATWKACAKTAQRIGSAMLTKSEVHVTYYDVAEPAVHEASNISYIQLLESLAAFVPVMERAFDYLSTSFKQRSDAELVMEDILAVWCAYSLAAREPFSVIKGPNKRVLNKCHEFKVEEETLKTINTGFVLYRDTCIACTAGGDQIVFPEGIAHFGIPNLQWIWNSYNYKPDMWTITLKKQKIQQAKTLVLPKSFSPYDSTMFVPKFFAPRFSENGIGKELISNGDLVFVYYDDHFSVPLNQDDLDNTDLEAKILVKVYVGGLWLLRG